jgi:hypothetical protein
MNSFSNDVDILKYESVLFGELHLPNQVLISGTGGVLSGTTFTAAGADFNAAKVTAGGVIYLQSADGTLDGAYEIISVDSAAALTVSVVRADTDDDAVAPKAASDIAYRVSTFAPQAREAAFQLTEYFGINPGDPASDITTDDIMDTQVLKAASVFAIIATVYAMLSGSAEDNLWKKSEHYQKLFEKARRRCRVSIDTGDDGVSDITKMGSSFRMVRD